MLIKSPDISSLLHGVINLYTRLFGWSVRFGKISLSVAGCLVFFFLCCMTLLIFKQFRD